MTPRTMKFTTFIFMGLTAALAVNLTSLQPMSSVRLAGRTLDRGIQRGLEQPQTIASADAEIDAKSRPRLDGRTPPPEKKPASAPRTTASISAEPVPAGDGPETIRAVQRELQARGYEAGTPDGVPGLVTRAAVLAYEYDHGLPMSAEPSERLLKRILLGENQPAANPGTITAERAPQAEQVIRTVQQSLANAGYAIGKPDGRMGEETVRAIREFETDQGLPETGRVSGQLVARLARLAGQGRLTSPR